MRAQVLIQITKEGKAFFGFFVPVAYSTVLLCGPLRLLRVLCVNPGATP
jgi:hypothetical protein